MVKKYAILGRSRHWNPTHNNNYRRPSYDFGRRSRSISPPRLSPSNSPPRLLVRSDTYQPRHVQRYEPPMSVINWHKDRQETPPDEVYWPSQELPQEHAPPVLNRRKSTTITTSNLAEWQRPAANFKATFPPSKGPPALLIYPTDTLYDITRTLARFLEPNFIGLSIASTGERLTPALWGIVCEEALRRHAPAIALGFLYRSFTVRFRYPYSAPLVVRARETLAGLEARMVVGDPGRLESVVRLRGDGGSERPKWWCRETMGSWGDRLTERTWALMRDEALKNGTEDLRLAFVDGDV